jgi:hypothetical protein
MSQHESATPPFGHEAWTFEGPAGDRLRVVRAGTPFEAPFEPVSAWRAASLLRAWLRDWVSIRRLRELHAALFGHLATESLATTDYPARLLHDLEPLFERGDLVILSGPETTASPALHRDPPQAPGRRPSPAPRRSWIEIELLDEDGRRVATELLVTLPDGTKLRPSFPGFVRLDGIDPGTCDIEFPKIDGREWGPFLFRR